MSDLSAYPANWPQVSYQTKVAAGWRCVRCGHPTDKPGQLVPCDALCTHAPAPIKQRMLTVHHLDGVKSNLEWWNLAALCQVCHLFVQCIYLPGADASMFVIVEAWLAPYELGRKQAEVVNA
jgi:5-methylcytosine-specific restriction endonuclease McrA